MSVNKASIGSDNGLSPIRHQAIIWTNADILIFGSLFGTYFSEIWRNKNKQLFSFKKIYLKMSSVKWSFCLALNGLTIVFGQQHSVLVVEGSLWKRINIFESRNFCKINWIITRCVLTVMTNGMGTTVIRGAASTGPSVSCLPGNAKPNEVSWSLWLDYQSGT